MENRLHISELHPDLLGEIKNRYPEINHNTKVQIVKSPGEHAIKNESGEVIEKLLPIRLIYNSDYQVNYSTSQDLLIIRNVSIWGLE